MARTAKQIAALKKAQAASAAKRKKFDLSKAVSKGVLRKKTAAGTTTQAIILRDAKGKMLHAGRYGGLRASLINPNAKPGQTNKPAPLRPKVRKRK